MSELQLNGDGSPFDAIRRVTPEGREYWSARELMPLLGYEKWERFADAIDRAKIAAHNSGYDVAQNFPGAGKVSGSRGPAQSDYHLSRYACYLVAMCSDPRKPEVAAALTYFAIRTREAETRPILPDITTADGLLALTEMFSDTAKRLVAVESEKKMLTAAIERDAPLVAKAEAHTGNAKAINRQTFAREVQAWGVKQDVNILQEHVYEMLRRKGMLIDGQRSDRNHATAQAVKSGWAWTQKDITEDGYPTAVTLINPRGQDIAWKWITEYVRDHGSLVLPPKITGAA